MTDTAKPTLFSLKLSAELQKEIAELNANLIPLEPISAELIEVYTKTGLTPRELLEQRDQAIADQIRLMNLLESAAFFLKQALTIETRTPLVDNNDPDKNSYVYQGCLNRLRIELARRQSALAKGGKEQNK